MNDDGTNIIVSQQRRDLVFGDWTSAAIFVPRRVWIGDKLLHHLLRCYFRAVLGEHRPQVSGQFRLAELGKDILSGQIVGELGFLAPGQLRTQTLECIEDGEVLQITYQQVKQLYYQNPQFGFYFLQLTTRRLFENISSLERDLAACKAASISVGKV